MKKIIFLLKIFIIYLLFISSGLAIKSSYFDKGKVPFTSCGLGFLVVCEIEIMKLLFSFAIFLVSVVFPAPEGEDKTNIIPVFFLTMIILIGLMLYQ